jgi:hypothetical protein
MALLAKAQSTDAQPEAAALVERSYRLLAELITQHDQEQGETLFGPRRRERRFLRDRRGDRRGQPSQPADASDRAVTADSEGRFRRLADSGARYRRTVEATADESVAIRLTL